MYTYINTHTQSHLMGFLKFLSISSSAATTHTGEWNCRILSSSRGCQRVFQTSWTNLNYHHQRIRLPI